MLGKIWGGGSPLDYIIASKCRTKLMQDSVVVQTAAISILHDCVTEDHAGTHSEV